MKAWPALVNLSQRGQVLSTYCISLNPFSDLKRQRCQKCKKQVPTFFNSIISNVMLALFTKQSSAIRNLTALEDRFQSTGLVNMGLIP
ncbi:hypothetical protein FKM82_010910 [Ascaphus truei]